MTIFLLVILILLYNAITLFEGLYHEVVVAEGGSTSNTPPIFSFLTKNIVLICVIFECLIFVIAFLFLGWKWAIAMPVLNFIIRRLPIAMPLAFYGIFGSSGRFATGIILMHQRQLM